MPYRIKSKQQVSIFETRIPAPDIYYVNQVFFFTLWILMFHSCVTWSEQLGLLFVLMKARNIQMSISLSLQTVFTFVHNWDSSQPHIGSFCKGRGKRLYSWASFHGHPDPVLTVFEILTEVLKLSELHSFSFKCGSKINHVWVL